jgi:hypothetical protein
VPGGILHEKRLHIEHGHQHAFENSFRSWPQPILAAPDGKRRLERAWGTMFLDVVFNEIQECLPVVNHVHPHIRLALIVLRSLLARPQGSTRLLGRLGSFFARKGWGVLWHSVFLGEEQAAGTPPGSDPTPEEVLDFLDPSLPPERRGVILAEAHALLAPAPPAAAADQPDAERGWLGESEERGLRQHSRKLLQAGDVTVVAFGHTHEVVDGEAPLGLSDPRRIFNTGSWMPHIQLGSYESPSLSALTAWPRVHDIRYLVIDLSQLEQARLAQLLTPSKPSPSPDGGS